MLLSGQAPTALSPNLAQVWQWGLDNAGAYSWGKATPERQRLEAAYADRRVAAQVPPGKQSLLLAWCLEVVQKRVDAIVGNQHRKAYSKAAVLTAACAETLTSRGDAGAARGFVNQIRNRFPRHRAFQADLNSAAP